MYVSDLKEEHLWSVSFGAWCNPGIKSTEKIVPVLIETTYMLSNDTLELIPCKPFPRVETLSESLSDFPECRRRIKTGIGSRFTFHGYEVDLSSLAECAFDVNVCCRISLSPLSQSNGFWTRDQSPLKSSSSRLLACNPSAFKQSMLNKPLGGILNAVLWSATSRNLLWERYWKYHSYINCQVVAAMDNGRINPCSLWSTHRYFDLSCSLEADLKWWVPDEHQVEQHQPLYVA